ncbi:hypothetical protein PZH39_16930, partial [Desulfovibrio desulfuricans]|uniref:hypothetical protein n=1 Tax=Desulfovibrio desulfuricans TaxID=876 RepID=UPI0023AEE81A
ASNAFGMRDKERTKDADQPRVVILGDSFIEGWGNRSEDRCSSWISSPAERLTTSERSMALRWSIVFQC